MEPKTLARCIENINQGLKLFSPSFLVIEQASCDAMSKYLRTPPGKQTMAEPSLFGGEWYRSVLILALVQRQKSQDKS
jgi:hypothetical protein